MSFKKSLAVIIGSVAMTGMFAAASTTTQTVFADSNKSVTIYLTRHGETTANVMDRVQGWSNFPLTSRGIKVADDLGKGLKGTKFHSAYSGDLTRQEVTAKETLKYSGNKNVRVNESKNLREGGYGSFEGDSIAADNSKIAGVYGYKTSDEFMKKTGKDYWTKLQDAYHKLDAENSQDTKLATADRAESSEMVQKRMTTELNKIAKDTSKDGGGNVLVVSSGMSINEYLATMSKKYEGKPLKNAAVTKLVYKDGKLHVSGPIGTLSYVNKGEKVNN